MLFLRRIFKHELPVVFTLDNRYVIGEIRIINQSTAQRWEQRRFGGFLVVLKLSRGQPTLSSMTS